MNPREAEERAPAGLPFVGWRKQPDPDPERVRALYSEGMGVREIAQVLHASRHRVTAAVALTGGQFRRGDVVCPVTPDELRALVVDDGLRPADLKRRFGVAAGTVERWLAECGLGKPDPQIDHGRLVELYVDREMTVREVGAELRVSHNRVIRELARAGVPRRSRHHRPPRGGRERVTAEALHEAYVVRGLTVRAAAAEFGVGVEYLRKRLRECGIARRPGLFRPRTRYEPAALQHQVAEMYVEEERRMWQVAADLQVSTSTVRQTLHEAQVPVRPAGPRNVASELRERRLVEDLYADPEVRQALKRNGVVIPQAGSWRKASPFESYAPMPLREHLLRELNVDLGLAIYHVALLCGVGNTCVRSRLHRYGIPLRSARPPCPWVERTYLRH